MIDPIVETKPCMPLDLKRADIVLKSNRWFFLVGLLGAPLITMNANSYESTLLILALIMVYIAVKEVQLMRYRQPTNKKIVTGIVKKVRGHYRSPYSTIYIDGYPQKMYSNLLDEMVMSGSYSNFKKDDFVTIEHLYNGYILHAQLAKGGVNQDVPVFEMQLSTYDDAELARKAVSYKMRVYTIIFFLIGAAYAIFITHQNFFILDAETIMASHIYMVIALCMCFIAVWRHTNFMSDIDEKQIITYVVSDTPSYWGFCTVIHSKNGYPYISVPPFAFENGMTHKDIRIGDHITVERIPEGPVFRVRRAD